MGRIELPQAACFDFPEGLSNQNVQECSSGCFIVICFPKDEAVSSDSPTISPSSPLSSTDDDLYSSKAALFSSSAIFGVFVPQICGFGYGDFS